MEQPTRYPYGVTYDPNYWEKTQAEKKADRARDAHLIATGQATPEEIQRRNSLFPRGVKMTMDWDAYYRNLQHCRNQKAKRLREERRLKRLGITVVAEEDFPWPSL